MKIWTRRILAGLASLGWFWLLSGFTYGATGSRVLLGWDANPEPDIAGYKVYVGLESHIYELVIDVGKVTCTIVSNLQDCIPHYFALTAYNEAGLESDFSNEVRLSPSCVKMEVSVAETITGPWESVFRTNLPIRTRQMFFRTQIQTEMSTNRATPGIVYQCLDGHILITTNVPPLTNRPALIIPPPPSPAARVDVLGPFTNLFWSYP